MRTTLDIEEELLAAAKEIANREHRPIGQVVSRLMRQALTMKAGAAPRAPSKTGFRPFASRGQPVTNATVDNLRDKEGV